MSAEPAEPPKTVTVTPPGEAYDSLWSIAEELFEDGSRWRSIYDENRDVLQDPGAVRPGMTLRLPLEFYPGHVRAVAEVYDAERVELAGFVRQAAAELNGIGNFWGSGQSGTAFFKGQGGAQGYEAASAQVMEGVEALQNAHGEIPARLRLMADRVQVGDWDSVLTTLSELPEPGEDPTVWGEPSA